MQAWSNPVSGTSPSDYAALKRCTEEAIENKRDISVCKSTVASSCEDTLIEADDVKRRFDCARVEEYAWTRLALVYSSQVTPDNVKQSDFSEEEFLAELEQRHADTRENCFQQPIGAEVALVDCLIDRRIDEVKWLQSYLDIEMAE
ncbi:hypothetical protein [Pseudaestuariivita rosea]|uniref:hypothetical protein n=1 Tax=Pseudaestuariivita rosea TaxID=2763263 RepID=UPI001ABADF4B|nr:hypothetical protein [Pseudaestuariivita rosea]